MLEWRGVMIEKFVSIKNIGRFRDCTARGDVAFRKLTLLFAENGKGKTTLCAILRSLQTGQPQFISERRTLGLNNAASVQIRLGGNSLSFSNNAWSGTHPDIAVFDSVFIHNNVYAGDYVASEHKRNLYRVIVGQQGVALATRIEQLDGTIRDANTTIRTKSDAVSRTLPDGVSLDTYIAWQPVEDVDTKIQQKTTDVASQQRAVDKATEIQSKNALCTIELPALPTDLLTILAKRLTDVTADAEERVRRHIADHHMGDDGETWLSQGLEYVANEACPYCGQGIGANTLLAAYRTHFDEAYTTLKQEVAQLGQRTTTAVGEVALNTLQQSLSTNLTLLEFWRQFDDLALPEFPFDEVKAKYAELQKRALALAQQKERSPTDAVSPDATFHTALQSVDDLQRTVDAYNAAVETCNTLISAQKASIRTRDSVDALKAELAMLEAKKKRFEDSVVRACEEHHTAIRAKAQLDEQKRTAREELDRYCSTILSTYETSINDYLDQFNTGFRIANTRHNYQGGTPRSVFQIQINGTTIDLGDARTNSGTHCFKTTLSSGDRSALALAFFLAALKQDPQIADKIVILDDPFTSQDRFRRTCTQQLIRQLAERAKQVVVLSHDPHFLQLIWEGYPAGGIKTLQLYTTGDNTIIGEWDIEAETQSTYIKNYSALLDFYRDRTGVPLNVARSIRPFLEGMLRMHFPGRFEANEWLGDFIGKIRDTDATDGLQHAKADLVELEATNDFSKKYHHDQNTNADTEPLSPDELHGFVKRTLRLVGGC